MKWIAFVLGALVACGRIEAPPSCAGVYQSVFAWKRRCAVPIPENAGERAVLFCQTIDSASGIRWEAQEACMRALETAECERFPHECVLLGAGTLPGGAPCTNLDSELEIHSQCQSGLCDAQCGACTTARVEGSECGEGTCSPGFTCKIEFGKTIGACVVANGKDGSACSTATDCSAATYCDYNSRVCEVRRSKDAPCWSGHECAAGLVCGGGAQGTCVEPARLGEWCTDRACADGLVCLSARCTHRTEIGAVLADGMPCDATSTCDSFARCILGKCAIPTLCK